MNKEIRLIAKNVFLIEPLDEINPGPQKKETRPTGTIAFPLPHKYAVDLTITKITRRKLRLVDTEDTL